MNSEIAIRTENLTKAFGGNVAVNNLNLEVKKGELFGLVGPDGAGKTTIMRLLAAIMEPTSGNAWVAGYSILTEGELIKEEIGYMSQRFGLYEDLTVMENIMFYADLYGVPARERPPRVERLLGFSNLTPFKERLAGNLSGGMKQKLGLACALIHTPRVLFLDEPTNGVDPVSRRDFWKILYDLLKEEITVFVSTAYLDEAERCTRIGLIHKGTILTVDEPSSIRESLQIPMVEISSAKAKVISDVISTIDGVINVSMYGDRLHVGIKEKGIVDQVLTVIRGQGVEIEGYREIVPSLEDAFIALVDREEGKRP
ncbi:MAG TPA: ABC transporter ATP-binding protein [Syntrophorhabdus sp.]|jgi:ABC-2 type transport system ATP-binding protein|nr:ABC transporter ATP-binding protein [Syntrophorhabdus sp.]OQB77471.1 MAG: putative ABC transporter ATP-binding protein YbhF [Deltaproteobacteria bacterium ADurb.Bin135]MBP8745575.1 ABC transporter ATP-binding protein [Syntrophorhabdus sp.]HNQ46985.1 ABC transporter ATP-binding protein [Syntrophorhabdus sp.]HNY69472.1 ABC transporter ATP-binding protein [Syntrophorhabdus sp.]